MVKKGLSGFAIAGFVISLIGAITYFIPLVSLLFSVISIIFSIISLISINNNNQSGKSFAIIGLIIAFMTIVLVSVILISQVYKESKETEKLLNEVREATLPPIVIINLSVYTNEAGATDQKAYETMQLLSGNQIWIDSYKDKYDNYPQTINEVIQKGYNVKLIDSFGNTITYKLLNEEYIYSINSKGKDGLEGSEDDIILLKKG